jgi:molecular chaperone GrpE
VNDENRKNGDAIDDDAYVIEDTGGTVEDIEHEMELAAKEAAADGPPDGRSGADTLRGENQDLRDRYMRTLADFENFRKRADRERSDFARYANATILKDLLPIIDNFDRALEHAEEGDEFHKGVLLIYKQLVEVFEKHGLKAIGEVGVHFDPNIHEAVIREEDPSVPSHTVVAILQKGYFLHDRLLRPALVKVAVGGPEGASN